MTLAQSGRSMPRRKGGLRDFFDFDSPGAGLR